MNKMEVGSDIARAGFKSKSAWRYSIEKLTADCIEEIPPGERVELSTLGILANIGNSRTFEFY